MQFTNEIIEQLDLDCIYNIVRLIIEFLCGETHLCGEEHYTRLLKSEEFKTDHELLTSLLDNAKKGEMNYEQFNELLLLLNQDRVSKLFFQFFLWKTRGFRK